MLDPRIYRAGLVVAALALAVLAFSLPGQQGALSTPLAPAAFAGARVSAAMRSIQGGDPIRLPGSSGDDALAAQVASTLRADGFQTTVDTFRADAAGKPATLENVVGVLPGMQAGSVAIVAPRDLPGLAGASPTAMLLELARDLGGETLHRTVVLASVSGSAGALGERRLVGELPGPVDAAIVLGDVAAANPGPQVVMPWSSSRVLAPTMLRNTLAAQLGSQASLSAGAPGLGAQFAHLAFPLTPGLQGPLNAAGIPAVELSLSGEDGPAAAEPVAGPGQVTDVGHAVLSAISALDAGPAVPPPASYLILDGRVIPGGGLAALSIALLVPLILVAIDAAARAQRRGGRVLPSTGLVLAAAVPFAAAGAVVLVAALAGVLPSPPGPLAPGVLRAGAGARITLGLAALVAATGLLGVGRLWQLAQRGSAAGRRASGRARGARAGRALASARGGSVQAAGSSARAARVVAQTGSASDRTGRAPRGQLPGAATGVQPPAARPWSTQAVRPRPAPAARPWSTPAREGPPALQPATAGVLAATLLVLCAAALAIWLENPFAALALMPALHLWLWAVNPDLRLPAVLRLALVAAGLVPPALIAVYYAGHLGYGPGGLVWQLALLLAGHGIGLGALAAWSVLLGALAWVLVLCVTVARSARAAQVAVTVRGPLSYAGPGSLGGTGSALRH
ncbi:MAG TPA: hypothetical protein VKV27_05990 [Solirubrobacteraceae bacterium]|nr:hypothetical protein [Solirubrobacteraceae bacterium]